jgi:hypothetical protein
MTIRRAVPDHHGDPRALPERARRGTVFVRDPNGAVINVMQHSGC